MRLISADNLRIGGADQLRTYAAILGVPFQAVESTVALAQAIDAAPAEYLASHRYAGLQRRPAWRIWAATSPRSSAAVKTLTPTWF